MKCIYCGCAELKVIDSRPVEETNAIRRRRECTSCGKRFTTYETVEESQLLVVKNSGDRQIFDVNKLKNGIVKSCEKRPVSMEQINALVAQIQKRLNNSLEQEVTSKYIGELVMDGLKEIDEVAYIRFASVYRKFKDSTTFFEEMKKIFEPSSKN
ncbi:MAG: transcriptional repressor NrdR [Clostridia bacterium]|nr:transcriptional repressor NrdR [Clostridia bacterium]